ncbi:Capsule polysaccharide biosynthesis protein [Novipirellula aureliae]|uniref:Capsule polysaccharide biosynthesis protein n=1 Tax=Novipirellula aureliae TaxID=2527966 RepID=A0A5C6E4Z1_9BACT|nr:hypothetical protein [Novipirellula aureliae]TWU43988.1 Capsule polysaccharide biosynthesis protein [Novipirellula aureliae]
MNVVFTFLVDWTHHLATELELLHKHIEQGDSVAILTCLNDVPSCITQPSASLAGCRRCIELRQKAIGLLPESVRMNSLSEFLTPEDYQEEGLIDPSFKDIEHAKHFRVDDWDCGYAAVSTTIHNFRDHNLSTPESQNAYRGLVISGFRAHRAMSHYLSSHKDVDRVYLFNGRFAMARGIMRACQRQGVDAYMHERGANNTKYQLFKNHLPHDRPPFLESLNDAWHSADPEVRETEGATFFTNRRMGIEDGWTSFTKKQRTGFLPESWDPAQRNLVIFNSSEDEFIGIGEEWKNPIYPSQGIAIQQIANDLQNTGMKIYVRMHPNLSGVNNSDTDLIKLLDGKGVEIILPESRISTYDLIGHAEKVLSFGSTVGVEANYWGTPSVLAGMSFYRELGATYNAQSHQDVLELLQAKLSPKHRLGALQYGYYLRTFGIPFEYYKANSFHSGCYQGQQFPPSTRRTKRSQRIINTGRSLFRNYFRKAG